MNVFRKYKELIFAIPFSAALVIINVIRIVRIPITIDETGYIPGEPYHDLFFKKYASANNHILHSVIRKFFVDTFGNTLFFLRVDSLLAQIAFLIYSYLICRLLFKGTGWVLTTFVILNICSPFVFDFWGLSRGYALSLNFMTISIYSLLSYLKTGRILQLSLATLGACLAVYSNFALLNYYAAFLAVVVLQRILFRKEQHTQNTLGKELLILALFTGALASLITGPLILLHQGGELAFLGGTGFKNDTVTSLVRCSIFNRQESFEASQIVRVVYYGTVLLSTFWLYVFVGPLGKKYPFESRVGITLHLLLILPAIALVAQYHLFHINYIIDRAAIFFTILYLMQLVYLLYYLQLTVFKYAFAINVTVMLLLGYNFFSNLNMHRAFLWWADEADLVVLERMHDEWKDKPRPIKLWAEWEFLPAFKYDIDQHYKSEFSMADGPRTVDETDTTYDYLYLRNDDVPKVPSVYKKDTAVCGGGSFILFRKN